MAMQLTPPLQGLSCKLSLPFLLLLMVASLVEFTLHGCTFLFFIVFYEHVNMKL